MFKRIKLHNIQSHKNTTIEFSPGVNAIVGESNNGKTAIMRALYWLVYNRPLGVDTLLSHWAIDKKGKQAEEMSFTLETDRGVVTRRRTKDENQYIVNNTTLNVVKTDVPEEVANMLHLGDVNIQKQQDSPFLLSMTSGQVAQYFNKTVRLDAIDRILSTAESWRRDINNNLKNTEKKLTEARDRQESYAFLETAKKLLHKEETYRTHHEDIQSEISFLRDTIDDYEFYQLQMKKLEVVFEAKSLVEKLCRQQALYNEIVSRKASMNEDIEKYNSLLACTYGDFAKEKECIENLNNLHNELKKIQDEIESIEDSIDSLMSTKKTLFAGEEKIEELKNMLPDVCPLCGKKR